MAKREEKYINAETAPRSYANSVLVSQSPFDFKFYFGQIEEANPERIVTSFQNAIYMSPQHAKVFATILTKHIARFESMHGAIPTLAVDDPVEEAK